LSLDTILRPPPKGIVRKSAFNPHARVAQNYNIVEDLAQAPSAMSALEVLQICPTQWKALLKSIGGINLTDTNLIIFDLEDHIPRLPPQLAFQIQLIVSDKNICRTIIDEGASTCVMSVTYSEVFLCYIDIWFLTYRIRSQGLGVSLLHMRHLGIFTITVFLQCFRRNGLEDIY
jgi:hypothetical protein